MKIYTHLLSSILALSLILTSVPVVASIDPEVFNADQISATDMNKLNYLLTQNEVNMDMETFEQKLEPTMIELEKKSEKTINRLGQKKAEKRYQQLVQLIMKSHNEQMKAVLTELEATSLTTKEKLIRLNQNPEHRQWMKAYLLEQVKLSGSVKAFLKKVKQQLNEKKDGINHLDNNAGVIYAVLIVVLVITIAVVFGIQAALGFLFYALLAVAGFVLFVFILILYFIIAWDTSIHGSALPLYESPNFTPPPLY